MRDTTVYLIEDCGCSGKFVVYTMIMLKKLPCCLAVFFFYEVGCFNSKSPYFLMFLEHSNFPTSSIVESCSETDKSLKNSSHSCIAISYEYTHIVFSFPSQFLTSYFAVQLCGLRRYISQAVRGLSVSEKSSREVSRDSQNF